MPNRSDAEQFERLYTRLWAALHRPDDPDLTQHEREVLHHVPATGGIDLTGLARHLALPKSTASVLAKDLAARGFLTRRRDPADERRLQLVLTAEGRRRVEADHVLEPDRLAAAMASLTHGERATLLTGLARLVAHAEHGR